MASLPPAYRRLSAAQGGNVAALSRAPFAASGGKLSALGYRAPQVEGGGGGVTIYPFGPLGVAFGEGAPIPIGSALPGFNIGGSAARLIPGRRPAPTIRRPQVQTGAPAAPVSLPTRGAGAPPQNFSLPGGYRIVTPPHEVGTIPSRLRAPVSVGATLPVSLPQLPAPRTGLTTSAVETSALPVQSETAVESGGGYLPQRGLLASAISALGLVEAARALESLLRGESLTGSEFGALAGAIIGAFGENPAAGAKIGATVGTVVDALNALSVAQTGRTIDQWMTAGTKDLWQNLTGQGAPPPPSPPIYAQPGQAPTVPPPPPPPIYAQPGGGPGGGPIEIPRQPPFYPPAKPPLLPSQPGGGPGGNLPWQPGQPGGGQIPCPTCAPVQEGDCPPEVQQLVEQIANCPPQLLQRIFNRLQIRQPTGKPPTIEVIEPVCLCCDSSNDLDAYMRTGGVQGSCVQVAGATVSDVQRRG